MSLTKIGEAVSGSRRSRMWRGAVAGAVIQAVLEALAFAIDAFALSLRTPAGVDRPPTILALLFGSMFGMAFGAIAGGLSGAVLGLTPYSPTLTRWVLARALLAGAMGAAASAAASWLLQVIPMDLAVAVGAAGSVAMSLLAPSLIEAARPVAPDRPADQ